MPFGLNPGNITDKVNDTVNGVTDTVNDTVESVSGGSGSGGGNSGSSDDGSSGGTFGDIIEREQNESDGGGFDIGFGGGSFSPGDLTGVPDSSGGSGGSGGGSGSGNQQQQAMSPDEIQEMLQQQQQQFQQQLGSIFEGLGQGNSGETGGGNTTLLVAGAVAVGAVVLGVFS